MSQCIGDRWNYRFLQMSILKRVQWLPGHSTENEPHLARVPGMSGRYGISSLTYSVNFCMQRLSGVNSTIDHYGITALSVIVPSGRYRLISAQLTLLRVSRRMLWVLMKGQGLLNSANEHICLNTISSKKLGRAKVRRRTLQCGTTSLTCTWHFLRNMQADMKKAAFVTDQTEV